MIRFALSTCAAGVEGQQQMITNLNRLVLYLAADCAHNPGTFVAQNRRKLNQRQKALLKHEILKGDTRFKLYSKMYK